MATGRLPFSESQVRRYFQRVGFQEHNSFSDLPPPTLHTVRRLIACHLQTIPFENLSLHYSTHPQIFLGDAFLFDKMVDRRKGGYCMEQNTLFAGILRTLGYDLYTIGARVYLPNDSKSRYPSGIIHMAIIVTINSVDYLVDVGFGGKGLTAPLPVFDDTSMEVSIHGVLPEEHRLSRRPLSGGNKNGALPFVLECRNNPQAGWEPLYIFQRDFELFPADYEVYIVFNLTTNPQGSIHLRLNIPSLFLSTTFFARRSVSMRSWRPYHAQLYGM